MQQTAEPSPSTGTEIVLSRGETGLGFNIRGGVDNPHIPGDSGIFVTKVRENGAAFSDGRLKEGDKILMINGKSLVGVTHEEAVSCFTRAKETVTLVVEHGAQAKILKQREDEQRGSNRRDPPKSSNSMKFVLFGVGGIGLIVAGFYIYKRFNKGLASIRIKLQSGQFSQMTRVDPANKSVPSDQDLNHQLIGHKYPDESKNDKCRNRSDGTDMLADLDQNKSHLGQRPYPVE